MDPKRSQIELIGKSLEGPNRGTCNSFAGASVECSPGCPISLICSAVSDNFAIIQTDVAPNGAGFVLSNKLIDLGFPPSSSSVVEPAGELVSITASELLEYGFPVSSPSGDEPSGACASGAASSSIT